MAAIVRRSLAALALMSMLIAALAGFSSAIDRGRYELRNEQRIAHYISEDTGIGFVLDRSSEFAKFKFDTSEEIFALQWQPAANGDRNLVPDYGEPMLRIAYIGGITFFRPGDTRGIPVAFDRQAPPLIQMAPSMDQVQNVAGQIMQRLRAEVGRDIVFEADWRRVAMDAGGRAVLYDAIRNAGTALINVANAPAGRVNLARGLQRVRFMQAGRSGVYMSGPILVITFSVEQGLAGRPSSVLIGRVLTPFMR